jgi:hypothetical protein
MRDTDSSAEFSPRSWRCTGRNEPVNKGKNLPVYYLKEINIQRPLNKYVHKCCKNLSFQFRLKLVFIR